MHNDKQIRGVRHLCSLGIPAHMLVPALIREMQSVIPSYSAAFLWHQDGRFTNLYDPSPDTPRYGRLYMEEFLDRRDLEVQPGLGAWLCSGRNDIITTQTFAYRNFYQSTFYNEFLRPVKYHHSAMAAIRHGGQPMGIFMLHRSPGERDFGAKEMQVLASLIPHIAHAISLSGENGGLLIDSPERGVMIFDRDGKLLHLSPVARQLLFLATHSSITEGAHGELFVPEPLAALCRRQSALLEDHVGQVDPPVWHHRNVWGGFVFSAQPLESSDQGGSGLIAVTVHYQEPIALKVNRRCEELGLTLKQTQICVRLAAGDSFDTIAGHLGVSSHTVVDHVRKLYDKVGVDNRSALVATLLADSSPANGAGRTPRR